MMLSKGVHYVNGVSFGVATFGPFPPGSLVRGVSVSAIGLGAAAITFGVWALNTLDGFSATNAFLSGQKSLVGGIAVIDSVVDGNLLGMSVAADGGVWPINAELQNCRTLVVVCSFSGATNDIGIGLVVDHPADVV